MITLLLLLSVLATPVLAHFKEPVPPGWDAWAMRQWSVGGGRCCDKSDAWLYEGAWRYWYQGDEIGGVILELEDGTEAFVAKRRFVDIKPDDPNPTGSPVIWYHSLSDVYCFTPSGALG